MSLIEMARTYQIDYNKLKPRCTFKIQPALRKGQIVDISVIIPVRGRTEFHKIVCEYFLMAMENSDHTVAITFVEHADPPPLHYWMTKGAINHIFIPADGQVFNKCLCHNIGVLYGPRARYYLFHDTDILVPGQFFNMLMQNLQGKDAVQAFTRRRLILAQEPVTGQLIRGERTADFYSRSPHEYIEALSGAPGGSICVTKEMLIEVGFWEDCFFTGYSIEDQFFFNKLNLMGKLGFSDSPAIELIHLYHTSDHQLTTRQSDLATMNEYNWMNKNEQRLYIQSRKEYFLNYFEIPVEQ